MSQEYVLIEKTELASIADKVRSLSGSTEPMSVLEIDNKLDSANSTIDNAVAAVISALTEKAWMFLVARMLLVWLI